MKFQVKQKIKNKVFDINSIKKIADYLVKLNKDERDYCLFTVYFDDTSQLSDNSIKVFDNIFLENKFVVGVSLEYHNLFEGNQLSIRLFQRMLSDGEYMITSNNEEWYLVQDQKIKKIINQTTSQGIISKIVNWSFSPILIGIIGFLNIILLDILVKDEKLNLIIFIISLITIVLFVFFLTWYYPPVIISIGNRYKNIKTLINYLKKIFLFILATVVATIIGQYVINLLSKI